MLADGTARAGEHSFRDFLRACCTLAHLLSGAVHHGYRAFAA